MLSCVAPSPSLRCGPARLARDEGACRGSHVVVAHQAFADKERRNPAALELRKVGPRVEAAFGDSDAVAGDFCRQTLADVQRGDESAQVPVIDADKPRL